MKRSFYYMAIIGALLVVLVVVGATIWMSSVARNATNESVDTVSSFYLEELAGRRSQVVSSFFQTLKAEMERVADMLDEENLSSQEALREFIGDMKHVIGLKRFAFADENRVVYTDYATYMGGSRYAFLSGEQTDMTITTAGTYGGGKEICLAIPVADKTFQGKKLTTCFAEINLDAIASVLAFNTQESGTHFSLYYLNGENLTGRNFGPFGARQNLITEMQPYLTDSQREELSERFRNETGGSVQFVYDGSEQILYYSPIPEADWMITVIIPKSLIHDQIDGIQNKTMRSSTIQIIVTCAALLIYFAAVGIPVWKQQKTLLKKEHEIAVKDGLTGIGNKYAYTRMEETVNGTIRDGSVQPFGIIVCDVNGLKQVNDNQGHAEGDRLIQEASRILCEWYNHSPVFRVGGDEFVVFLRGKQYEEREELLRELNRRMEENKAGGGVVLSAGMAEFGPEDRSVHDVFSRADERMYERKKILKG